MISDVFQNVDIPMTQILISLPSSRNELSRRNVGVDAYKSAVSSGVRDRIMPR